MAGVSKVQFSSLPKSSTRPSNGDGSRIRHDRSQGHDANSFAGGSAAYRTHGRYRSGQNDAHHAAPPPDTKSGATRRSSTTRHVSSFSGFTTRGEATWYSIHWMSGARIGGRPRSYGGRRKPRPLPRRCTNRPATRRANFSRKRHRRYSLTSSPMAQIRSNLLSGSSNPAEIDKRVRGTEMEAMIAKGAQQQRNGVLASLGLVADSLRMLPTKEQAKNRTWSATEWAVERKGWIFITSSATEREALRPLHSLMD